MKILKSKSIVFILITVLCLAVPGMGFSQVQKIVKKPDFSQLKIKPDLQISSITITKSSETVAGAHTINIAAKIINTVRNTCARNFKVKVEWTENPTTGIYTYLAQGGIVSLCYNISSTITKNTKILNFTDTIPAGKFRNYKVTVDYMGTVAETDETNNFKNAGYTVPLRRFYAERTTTIAVNPDLIISKISVYERDGYIYIRPTIRNITSVGCDNVDYEFDIHHGAVTQPYSGVSFGGNSEFTLNPLGINTRDLGTKIYFKIGIKITRGCRELNIRNNSRVVNKRLISSRPRIITFAR